MSKRPAFQFYPSDWRNDAGLRLCSAGARALWIDMLCLMHEGDPYGHLTILGRPMTPEALAKLVGESPAPVRRWIVELRDNEVFSETEAGVIYSRRMVRDERLREVRASGGAAGAEHGVKGAQHGAKGGRPRKSEGASDATWRGDQKPPLEPPPSSSSSASLFSEDKSSGADGAVPDFDRDAWRTAVKVLTEQGKLPEPKARQFFGKLLSTHGLEARDMLAATASALVSGTQDPQSYLTRSATGIAKRRAPAPTPTRQSFV